MWYVTTRHDDVFEHDDERSVAVLYFLFLVSFMLEDLDGCVADFCRRSFITASLSM